MATPVTIESYVLSIPGPLQDWRTRPKRITLVAALDVFEDGTVGATVGPEGSETTVGLVNGDMGSALQFIATQLRKCVEELE